MDDSLNNPFGVEITNLGKMFKNEIKAISAKKGINSTYAKIIMMLSRNPEGVIQNAIVENTKFKASTISLTLKNLEQMGYLTRESSVDDNRKTIVKITPLGETYDLKIRECFKIVEEQMIKDISDYEIQQFRGIIAKMRKNLQQERGEE